ncbi:MAG: hypothetical protein ACE5EX_02745 [Phycisphaerae bacterium]
MNENENETRDHERITPQPPGVSAEGAKGGATSRAAKDASLGKAPMESEADGRAARKAKAVRRVRVELPMAPLDRAIYQPIHVDLQLRDPRQRETLCRLVDGLRVTHTMLNRRHVETSADAMRWLLEHIGRQAGVRQ